VGALLLATAAAAYPLFISGTASDLVRERIADATVTRFGAGLTFRSNNLAAPSDGRLGPRIEAVDRAFRSLADPSPRWAARSSILCPELRVARWEEVAVVPQKLGLLDELTIRENVDHPPRLAGRLDPDAEHVAELLEELGIDHLQHRYPSETSLGEQQRTSVARALVRAPALLPADEPTGHQDAASARRILDALRVAGAHGTCCPIATHNEGVIPHLDRVLRIADGRLTEGR